MNNFLIVAPMVIPLTTLILGLLFRPHYHMVRLISVWGAVALLATGLYLVKLAAADVVLVGQMGTWEAPYGISVVIDRFSAALVAVTGLLGLGTVLFGLRREGDPEISRDFHLFVHGLLTGVCGAFITADLFNLYVWFEVLLIGSFALLALGGGRRRLAGTIVYVALNMLATLLFLLAAGMVYSATGTLNFGELALIFRAGEAPETATIGIVLTLLSFSIKAALFPVFGWLPASYHVAWLPVSALFAGLLTKVGVYALMRIVTLVWPEYGPAHEVLLWVACATMLVGVFGAVAQNEVRRILSIHIVSQVGYMILGLAIMTPLALAGAFFALIHNIIVKANLFFIGGMAARLTGSERLAAMGGLYGKLPMLGVIFAISALALAGIPPLSGFWAKLVLIKASMEVEFWYAAGAALLTSIFTLLSMSKIWNEAFLKAHPKGPDAVRTGGKDMTYHWWVVSVLSGLAVLMGVFAGPVIDYALAAADQLLEPTAYFELIERAGGQ